MGTARDNKKDIFAMVLIVDDEPDDARGCFATLQPFLDSRRIRVCQVDVAKDSTEMNGCMDDVEYDLVLLDIQGIDSEAAIRKIRMRDEHLPVAMMTNLDSAELVRIYNEAGASTYITKANLIPKIEAQEGFMQSEEHARQHSMRRFAKRLERLIRGYQPFKRARSRAWEDGIVIKREPLVDGNEEELRRRVQYLKLLASMRKVAPMFPPVKQGPFDVDGEIVYEIPYYSGTTLRSIVLVEAKDRERGLEVGEYALGHVVSSMIERMYLGARLCGYNRSCVDESVFKRVRDRLFVARDKAATIKKWKREFVNHLLEGAWSREAPGTYRPPLAILDELQQDRGFRERMTPPWLSLIHGDLHFNNIMIDPDHLKPLRFKLIDPKGAVVWGSEHLGYNDPAYDLGKLLQSTWGLYDLIHAGYLRAEVKGDGLPALKPRQAVEYPLSGGMSGASLTVRRVEFRSWVKTLCKELGRFIEDTVENRTVDIQCPDEGEVQTTYSREDPDWRIRARYYAAGHMLAATPASLAKDVDLGIAVYVRGVEMLNEFYDDYKAGKYPPPNVHDGVVAGAPAADLEATHET